MSNAKSKTTRDGPLSTRDPGRAGMNAAIIARLRDRRKNAVEWSEPGHDKWRMHQHHKELLDDLIHEFEALKDV